MSTKLALSSALSVLMMASFALCGPKSVASLDAGSAAFGIPAKAELPFKPVLPGLR